MLFHAGDEFIPVLRLVQTQAGQVGRGARIFQIGRAQRIRLAPHGVFVDDRAVTRELQLTHRGRLTPHGNGLVHLSHLFPAALIAVFVGVRGVGVVDVQVFFVAERKDRQAEGDAVVVAHRYARQRRFAGADHVPARRVQVHHVAQGRHGDRPVRVARQYGFAGVGMLAADGPVVAFIAGRQRIEIRIQRGQPAFG
ncbi:hypothetical protein D3C72_1276020 [compost metagenome]